MWQSWHDALNMDTFVPCIDPTPSLWTQASTRQNSHHSATISTAAAADDVRAELAELAASQPPQHLPGDPQKHHQGVERGSFLEATRGAHGSAVERVAASVFKLASNHKPFAGKFRLMCNVLHSHCVK